MRMLPSLVLALLLTGCTTTVHNSMPLGIPRWEPITTQHAPEKVYGYVVGDGWSCERMSGLHASCDRCVNLTTSNQDLSVGTLSARGWDVVTRRFAPNSVVEICAPALIHQAAL